MQDLSWKDSYLVGESNIDREHKNLFKIATKAFAAVAGSEKTQKIKTIIHELMDYTKVHFYNEEQFMQRAKYPKLVEHQKLHRDIIISMNKFLKTINAKKINEIEKELAHFIEFWFINHIVYQDKRVSSWIKSQNISYKNVSWKSEYKVGEAIIDSEHQELFSIANEAFKLVPEEQKKEKIKEILHKLYDYTQKHFSHEEVYMKSLNYNNLEEHKIFHVNILESLDLFVKNCISMDIGTLENKLMDFIDISLVKHIVEEDMKITRWLVFLEELKEAKTLKEVP